MEPHFFKSLWEVDPSLPYTLDTLAARAKGDGFDGLELYLPMFDGDPDELAELRERHGLSIIAATNTHGATPAEHRESLEERVLQALPFKPLLISCHTGRDIFEFEDNLGLFEFALDGRPRIGSVRPMGERGAPHRAERYL